MHGKIQRYIFCDKMCLDRSLPNNMEFVSIALQIAVFIASVYKMFDALSAFIKNERIHSSAKSLTDVIDEWENVFAKDVNLILLKCFMKFVQGSGECSSRRSIE